jgi:hypothetical protein
MRRAGVVLGVLACAVTLPAQLAAGAAYLFLRPFWRHR